MYVQKIQVTPSRHTWLVIGNDCLPIKPIKEFLQYITNTEKSPNTIRCYANHLQLFWCYLEQHQKDWKSLKISDFALFINWLRYEQENIIGTSLDDGSNRQISTVNTILAAIASFYRYHQQSGNTQVTLTELAPSNGAPYKSFLHHIYKRKPIQKRILKLRQPKISPKTLTHEQILSMLAGCNNARDRFLLLLLYETGLRIGQALLLKHVDIKSWDNIIHIIPRASPHTEARNKASKPNVLHVSSKLMQAYSQYLSELNQSKTNEFVFVNMKSLTPLSYLAVRKLFMRLHKKTGIKASAHMFRHTRASNLIKTGWDASLVQKRLGHSSVQTTLDTYSHLDQNDLKNAYKNYLVKQGEK